MDAPRPRLVYLAHPIKDDPSKNRESILAYCQRIHTADVIPFVPYFPWTFYLNDNQADHRRLALSSGKDVMARVDFDELYICGPTITEGMEREILEAHSLGKPSFVFNTALGVSYRELLDRNSLLQPANVYASHPRAGPYFVYPRAAHPLEAKGTRAILPSRP